MNGMVGSMERAEENLTAEEAEALAAEAAAAAEAARAKVARLRQEAESAAAPAPESDTEESDTEESVTEGSDATSETTEADDADVDGDAGEAAPVPVRRRRVMFAAKALAVIIAVLGIAGLASTSAWIIVKHQQAEQQRSLNAEFAAAARQGVVTLMSLNFNSAADDVQRIVDNSTGPFKEDFEGQSADFIRVAEESKVITDATVTATGVKNMTEDTADVLVAAYSTVTNAQGAEEEPRTWRLIVSMARDGDQLKVAKVEFAP
ncbi:hypothetical protein [Mycolicibacterium bacteremicum]|uniref:Mammalian cell entry protein n=1 Tax=Mycolicibacterium bacteremicum TaxID=564198 RepID=A0A1W9YYL3_MYCBA|nr:hypothetical protein [Mycolicibacterium bacteremicum]MCV7431405.1 hypothetical protein [Mycolicibacterium bacteremicum]ORA05168.1 hypothetical protein BST17_10935 [Mycolicibacterium bacteremicum]